MHPAVPGGSVVKSCQKGSPNHSTHNGKGDEDQNAAGQDGIPDACCQRKCACYCEQIEFDPGESMTGEELFIAVKSHLTYIRIVVWILMDK